MQALLRAVCVVHNLPRAAFMGDSSFATIRHRTDGTHPRIGKEEGSVKPELI